MVKKCWYKIILGKTHFESKNFSSPNILFLVNFGSKKFKGKKKSESNKIFDLKRLWYPMNWLDL